jgi:quinone-modifying oxidoreductase subunit QmoC
MKQWQGWRKIKFESEIDHDFPAQIASIPGGTNIYNCIQCGTCSGMCPLSPYMDYTPRQIVAMIRAGFKGEVLNSYTTWLCASCYSCTVECPKEIKLTDIMYAAKRLAIREGVYPKRFPIPILANEFFKSVANNGRCSETWILLNLFLKTNPLKLLGQAKLGWRLLKTGRMSIKKESIERKAELKNIMKALGKETMIKGKAELAVTTGEGNQ